MSKRCSKCKETKSLDKFYKRKKNKIQLRSECKLCSVNGCKLSFREWKITHKERVNVIKKRSNKKCPGRYKAREICHNAITSNKLTKQPCVVCGKTEVEAHHSDYTKPLDVDWLCKKHHSLWHKHCKPYDEQHRPDNSNKQATSI